jgi:hypothetical protein
MVDEAVVAAQGLSADLEQQVAIAAGLMGMSEDEIRPYVMGAPKPEWEPYSSRQSGSVHRTVVVQRRSRFSITR